MTIRDAVQTNLVFLGLEAGDRDQALQVVAEKLRNVSGLGAEVVRKALAEREELGSTSVGNGFAIPHCKLPELDRIIVGRAQLAGGVDFGDRKSPEPVRFLFVVLSPPDQPTEHLRVLSQIARVLKHADLREALLQAADEAAVVAAVARAAEVEGL